MPEVAVPETMDAAWIAERGPAEAIRYGRLPVPRAGPTDVVVRVEAVAVNLVDTFVRSGRYNTPLPFPFILGRDVVGTVAECGPGATGFAPGERVWSNSLGHAGRQGPSAEFAVVPTDRLYHLPDGVDWLAAVAVLHPAASAYLALVTHGRLRAGDTVLVAGGAGHVGRVAIVIAAHAGARVLATAGAGDLEECRSLGAEAVFDYADPELAATLRSAAGAQVDVHLDTSGHHDLELAADLAAQRGRIVVMAGMGTRPELPIGTIYTRDLTLTGFAISTATTPELIDAATRVNQLLAVGALLPRRVEQLPLSAAAEAHRRLEAGEARGARLVLTPGD
jgi:NADPH:quinone reductase-like Zn-dependent oxidoreductase